MAVAQGVGIQGAGYTREVLDKIRSVLENEHGMRDVVIRPMGASAARLSIPIRIYYADASGERMRAFGKIMGSTEPFLERSMQLAKNLYLQTVAMAPIFGHGETARDMAEHQYRIMSAIHGCGVPTARPLGCHELGGGLHLLVAEFLEAVPITEAGAGPEVVEEAFSHLGRMHEKGIFHGDIKPENILVGDRVYILDVGRFRDDAPEWTKRAYDLACMICSFLGSAPPEQICGAAARHFSAAQLRACASYLDLVSHRPDIRCTAETKARLLELLA